MATYLQDEILTNLTITEDALTQLHQVFAARAATTPEQVNAANANAPERVQYLTYIIRFDDKGYRVFSLEELLAYFRQATYVERVIFTLESKDALKSNRAFGTFMELRLDVRDPSTCFLQVTSDTSDWVNASFAATKAVLARCKNRNAWARNAWTHLLIQLAGVLAGFTLSLWAAARTAPSLTIDNAFLISFLLYLLLFSNLWTYVSHRAHGVVNSAFPNLKFYRHRRDAMHWLLQTLVGGLVLAAGLYALDKAFTFVSTVLGTFIK